MNMDWKHPDESILRQIDIRSLLPQKEPFVMVGTLVSFDMSRVVTETAVASDNLFVRNGRMSAAGLLENIAQTCAARIGYINKYILGKGIDIGYIGAIRDCVINGCPEVGETIRTSVEVEHEIFGMILAKAEIRCGERVLVSSEIKIAIAKAEEQ